MLVKGNRVLFCSARAAGRASAISTIIRSLGLMPLIHEGLREGVRNSSIDREVRDDFYGAEFRVILLEEDATGPVDDHWAIKELEHVPSDRLLIYSTKEMTSAEIERLALPMAPIHVKSALELENALRTQLASLLEDS